MNTRLSNITLNPMLTWAASYKSTEPHTHTYTLSPRTSMSREQLEMLFLRPETSHHHALENHVQDDGAEGRALADTNGDYNT